MSDRDDWDIINDPEATEAEKDAATDRIIDRALAEKR